MHDAEPDHAPLRRLLHRWLVEYNPIYLLSASLCLAGMFLCSRSLAHESTGILAVAGIAEAYGIALVLGAALLVRLGQRRPAVVLALICALYQGDLTLHTEACVWLGSTGQLASAAWLLLFVGKLYALSWAMRLRISRGAWAVAATGALGVTLIPHLFRELSPRAATAVVGGWLAALATTGMYSARAITSRAPLDGWAETVRRRAVNAVWGLWALLLTLHVVFWNVHVALEPRVLLLVPMLAATRYLRSEAQVWATISAALVLTGVFLPEHLALVASVTALTLAARAELHRQREIIPAAARAHTPRPYRFGPEATDPFPVEDVLVRPTLAAKKRLFTGALFAAYVALWTMSWAGGDWPAHLVALDIGLTVLVALGAWRARARISIVPLVATYTHYGIQNRIVGAPQSGLAWGALSVSAGFLLLLVSLAASYWLRNTEDPSGSK